MNTANLNIKFRKTIDSSIISFGTSNDGSEAIHIYTAASQSHYSERLLFCDSQELQEFYQAMTALNDKDYRDTIRIGTGTFWSNIKFKFSGIDSENNIKVKTYITGFMFYSAQPGYSKITKQDFDALLESIRKCISK